jgi:hypothetical protein
MKSTIVLFVISLILICGCDERTEKVESGNSDSTLTGQLTVQLPGVLVAPSGDTVDVLLETDVILYYWLPLYKHDEMQADLLFLASLDTTILALPVQPDHDSRNHAQRVINNMGISLPVYLADFDVMKKMDTDILPSCLILTTEGEEIAGNGFGSPSRLLPSIHRGE